MTNYNIRKNQTISYIYRSVYDRGKLNEGTMSGLSMICRAVQLVSAAVQWYGVDVDTLTDSSDHSVSVSLYCHYFVQFKSN